VIREGEHQVAEWLRGKKRNERCGVLVRLCARGEICERRPGSLGVVQGRRLAQTLDERSFA
jgi:hypothetical protein